jgi:hypothetical protein
MEIKQTKNLNVMMNRIGLLIFGILFMLPFVSAYQMPLPAYDLYQIFVEQVFGGFWLSVLGLMFIMFVIMALVGGLSSWTTMTYCGLFLLAMAIGYTQPLIVIPLWGMVMFWSVTQVIRLVNVQSSLW